MVGSSRARLGTAWLMSTAGIALGAMAHPACAREGAGTLEEIVVTATKRSVGIQSVPFSITALSSETLEQANIKSLSDLTSIVPSLLRPGGSAGALSMRGGFGSSAFPGVDQDVGLFIDDVYVAGLADMNQEYFDIERIEVLRGPQGTLFGRNVTGGAVSIHTREPSFTPEYRLSVGYGNYSDYRAQAFLTGPLTETTAYKLALSSSGHDGYLNNVITGGDTGDVDNLSARGQLLYRPSDAVKILFGADVFHREGEASSQLFGTQQPGLSWPTVSYDKDDSSQYLGPEHPDGYVRTTSVNLLGRLEWDLGFASLTSISGYRDLEENTLTAGVGDPLNSDPVYTPSRYRQFTQEVRLSSPLEQRLRWVAGLFYLDGYRRLEVRPSPDYRMFGPPYTPATLPAVANLLAPLGYYHPGAFYRQDNYSESAAAFTEVEYDLASKLTATLGARYTHEGKHGFADRSNSIAYLAGPPLSANYDADWNAVTPKATLTFKPQQDLLFYVTATRGFKSGAFDASTPSSVIGLQTPSNPTYVWNYEVGTKGTFLDNRLLVNLAVFRMDYQDLQVAIFDPLAVSFAFKNAGRARDDGLELEIRGKPLRWLTAGASYTYQDGVYDDYVIQNTPPAPPTDNSGHQLVQTPKNSLSLFADAQWPMGVYGTFSMGGSVLFRSKVHFSDTNVIPDYIHDRTEIKGIVDLHATWQSQDDAWELALWGRNVTDERYLTFSVDVSTLYRPATSPLPNSIRLANWSAPPTYGVTLTRRF